MKKDAKTFKQVAKNCSQYHCDETRSPSATNSTKSHTDVSCKNCTHYEPSKVCSLDLYQEILENHHL